MSEITPYLESLQITLDDKMQRFVSRPFEWDIQRQTAAQMLADGKTQLETAAAVGVDPRTIRRWEKHPEFTAEKHKLVYLTGAVVKAERIILIKQVIHNYVDENGLYKSKKDLLDWVKLLREEVTALEFAEIMSSIMGGHSDNSSE